VVDRAILSRRQFLVGAAAGIAAVAGLPIRTFAQAARLVTTSSIVAVVSAEPAQIMQGFGASGAWWPIDLVRFRPEVRAAVADLLFTPQGIGLSVYRYNIGGGGTGVTSPSRAPESFLVSPGVYDWSRDAGGRLFLRMAAERGVPVLIGFVNSAPPAWTTNASSCGGVLTSGAEGPFAHYLVDVVTHLRDAEGITLSYLSPMNEPDNSFDTCGQEGMSVPVEQRAALIQAVGQELAMRAPDCQVIADESSRAGEQFMREAGHWLDVPGTAEYVAALAVHRYDYPNELILGLSDALSSAYGKPLWSTELCCFDARTGTWGQQYDPTIAGALMMANFMWQGITLANDAAFHWWVACSSVIGADPGHDPDAWSQPNDQGWNDGLLYYDPDYADNGNQRIYPTKRFFALGNFSRYVRPGDRRHEVIGGPRNLRLLVFVNAATSAGESAVQLPAPSDVAEPSWTVVVINNAPAGTGTTDVSLQLPVDRASPFVVEAAVETSAERDLDSVEPPILSSRGLVSAQVPPQSITSYVLRADYGS
jgi:O-glycosyl hydrolase